MTIEDEGDDEEHLVRRKKKLVLDDDEFEQLLRACGISDNPR